jgi:hypothetical protein
MQTYFETRPEWLYEGLMTYIGEYKRPYLYCGLDSYANQVWKPINSDHFIGYYAATTSLPTTGVSLGDYSIVQNVIWTYNGTAWVNSGSNGSVTSVNDKNGKHVGDVYLTPESIGALSDTTPVGDMFKSVYDIDNDGIIDTSKTAEHVSGYETATTNNFYGVIDGVDGFFPINVSGATWGNISGQLINQEDLTNALNSKVPTTRVIHVTGFGASDKGLYQDITIDIPDQLSDLSSDTDHQTVSQTQVNYWNTKQDIFNYVPEDKASKGVPLGYVPLNVSGKIDPLYLNTINVTNVTASTSFPTTPSEGWICVRTDEGNSYAYDGATWLPLANSSGYIKSVNGLTGESITIGKSDIGLSNVTNDAQIVASTSVTAGFVPVWIDGTHLTNGYRVVASVSSGSTDLITAGGVYDAISGFNPTIDNEVSSGSVNAVENRAIYYNLEGGNGHPGKVDKVSGYGLSQVNYTSEMASKLNGIQTGAERNVQPNWTETNPSLDSYILNKPGVPSDVASGLVPPFTSLDSVYRRLLKLKVDGSGPDWENMSASEVTYETTVSGLSFTNVQDVIDELATKKLNKSLSHGKSWVGDSNALPVEMQVATLPSWQSGKFLYTTTTESMIELVDGVGGDFLWQTDGSAYKPINSVNLETASGKYINIVDEFGNKSYFRRYNSKVQFSNDALTWADVGSGSGGGGTLMVLKQNGTYVEVS